MHRKTLSAWNTHLLLCLVVRQYDSPECATHASKLFLETFVHPPLRCCAAEWSVGRPVRVPALFTAVMRRLVARAHKRLVELLFAHSARGLVLLAMHALDFVEVVVADVGTQSRSRIGCIHRIAVWTEHALCVSRIKHHADALGTDRLCTTHAHHGERNNLRTPLVRAGIQHVVVLAGKEQFQEPGSFLASYSDVVSLEKDHVLVFCRTAIRGLHTIVGSELSD